MDSGEPSVDDGALVTFDEALVLVPFSRATLYRRIVNQQLKAVTTTPEKLFRRSDVLALDARVDHRTASRRQSDIAFTTPAGPDDAVLRRLQAENKRLREVNADLRMALREAEAQAQATAQATARKTGHLLDSVERLTRDHSGQE